MSTESVYVLLFAVAAGVAMLVRRLTVPYTVGLVVAGLVLGGLHVVAAPSLTKELLFTIFLPGLLFEAAFHLGLAEFRRNRIAITLLAVPGVVAAMALTALILAPAVRAFGFGRGFDWRYALVFGALIAATDPIAVVGLFRNLGAPRRLSVLVEGESLLNDGTGIVFFTLSLVIVAGGHVTAGGLVLQFVEITGLGAAIGIAVGLTTAEILRRVNDPMVEITLTTIAAYGSFVTAEHFHYSGVIATVVTGMLCGNYGARAGMTPTTRVAVETFWEYMAFALNSIVFLLIGFEADLLELIAYWPTIVAAYLAVMLGRVLIILGGTLLLRNTRERFPFAWSAVLIWGGLRGALPMVLALSLPHSFGHRDLIVRMTFGVVIISILGEGLTMAPLLRWLGIVRRQEERTEYDRARAVLHVARAALGELDHLARSQYTRAAVSAVRDEYRRRIDNAEEDIRDLHVRHESLRQEEIDELRHRLILVEKEALIEGFQEGAIRRDVYGRLLADLDKRLLEIESADDRQGATDDATPADDDAS